MTGYDKVVKNYRAQIRVHKSKLTKLENVSIDGETDFEIESRINKLDKYSLDFDKISDDFLVQANDTDFTEFEKEIRNLEDRYHSIRSNLKIKLNPQSVSPSNLSKLSLQDNSQNSFVNNIKVPDIQCPIFDGNPLEWMTFKETFCAIIHNNSNINPILKFTYLLDKLKNEAKSCIGHITLSASGYEKAWSNLNQRFDTKKLLIETHIDALTNIENIKKNSASELRKLLNSVVSHTSSLSAFGYEIKDLAEVLITHMIIKKFDVDTRKEWESASIEEFMSLKYLIEFIQKRVRVLESLEVNKLFVTTQPKVDLKFNNKKRPQQSQVNQKTTTFVANIEQNHCLICKKAKHRVFNCYHFKNLSPSERLVKIKEIKGCLNCLNSSHMVEQCPYSGCKICSKKHNTMLHIENKTSNSNCQLTEEPRLEVTPNTVNLSLQKQYSFKNVILPTALVSIKDQNGNFHECRALLDSGSESNFISKRAFENYKFINPTFTNVVVNGIGQTEANISQSITTNIKSLYDNNNFDTEFLVVEKISNCLPKLNTCISRWHIPSNVVLADPNFNISSPIEILLGAEIFFKVLTGKQLVLNNSLPPLQETLFGWIIGGIIPAEFSNNFSLQVKDDLSSAVKKFWEIENIPSKPFYSQEELKCETHFCQTHVRDTSGRYTVSLPLKENELHKSNSKAQAESRLLGLERKFNANPKYKQEYVSFVQEYIDLGHMVLSTDSHRGYFVPHNAVVKPSSTSTKLRVVFDASAKSSSNTSLNDVMMVGPVVQQDLFQIVLRFRKHRYVLTGDISKMYRQININPDQTWLQKILWRFNNKDPIQTYELTTVTYGAAAAPYLATRVLKQLSIDEKDSFPIASEILGRDFYVDDDLTGSDSIEETIQIQSDLTKLLASGGFRLCKWVTNDVRILENIPSSDCEVIDDQGTVENSIKTLGLMWLPKSDVFKFYVPQLDNDKRLTKRSVLSHVSKLYDPLGLIAPIILTAKLFIQSLWQKKLDWDGIIPLEQQLLWQTFSRKLNAVSNINVNRQIIDYKIVSQVKVIELHGFADASERAYGACIYVRSVSNDNQISVQLLCSKSRVAPLKTISIPRLELCAAHLLAKLVQSVIETMEIKFDNIYLWSDSSITLYWIVTSPHKLKTVVANRVSEIQALTLDFQWFHVSSLENPADVVSRGVMPDELEGCSLWWNGPNLLHTMFSTEQPSLEGMDHSSSLLEFKEEKVVVNQDDITSL